MTVKLFTENPDLTRVSSPSGARASSAVSRWRRSRAESASASTSDWVAARNHAAGGTRPRSSPTRWRPSSAPRTSTRAAKRRPRSCCGWSSRCSTTRTGSAPRWTRRPACRSSRRSRVAGAPGVHRHRTPGPTIRRRFHADGRVGGELIGIRRGHEQEAGGNGRGPGRLGDTPSRPPCPNFPRSRSCAPGLAPAVTGRDASSASRSSSQRSLKRHDPLAGRLRDAADRAGDAAPARRGKFLWIPLRGRRTGAPRRRTRRAPRDERPDAAARAGRRRTRAPRIRLAHRASGARRAAG